MITKTEIEDDYDPSENVFNNSDIPFPDEMLDRWFKDPKKIFLLPEQTIQIYLKKIKLTEKGRELLTQ